MSFSGAIRPATSADVPAILALHNEAITQSLAIWMDGPVDLANRLAWFNERQAMLFPVLIAEIDGAFAGFASYGAFRSGDGYRRTVEDSIYIDAKARGKGVGRALMIRLLDEAKSNGIHMMIAAIGLPNDASVALHARAGFVDAGTLRAIGLKNGQRLDLKMMQKQIS